MAKKKILVVDDEPNVIKMLETRLRYEGYDVVTASDGQQALDKARDERPDLILLDVMLPKLDGYGVCRQLRSDGKYISIPIVMLTACGQMQDIKKGMEKGADAYIAKPFNSEALLGIVTGLIGK